MRRMRLVGTVVAVMAASLAVMAPSAFANSTNNPQWEIGGAILGEGETKGLEAEASGAQILTASTTELECSSVTAENAEFKGSKAPAAGTASETLAYGGCHIKGKTAAECEGRTKGGATAAQIKTDPLTATLAFETEKAGVEQEAPTVSVFKPASGSTFVEVELKGTSCPSIKEASISGGVVAKNVNGQNLGLSHELEAPSSPITKYFVNNGGKTEEQKTSLKAFGIAAAKYIGKAIVWVLGRLNEWRVFN